MRTQPSTRRLAAAGATILVGLIASTGPAGARGPTCSDVEFLYANGVAPGDSFCRSLPGPTPRDPNAPPITGTSSTGPRDTNVPANVR